MTLGQQAQQTTTEEASAAQQIPDAPRPQVGLPTVNSVRPGMGTTPTSNDGATPADQAAATPSQLPSTPAADQKTPDDDGPPPDSSAEAFKLVVRTNFVEVPFTVKDNKQRLVPGLTWREVKIYENNVPQRPAIFTTDPMPLSVAIVVDQSLTQDNMTKVNNSLAALQGAFAPYDEVAVFTYNNGPRKLTDFTGSQSARLNFALERAKAPGRETYMNMGGPMSQTNELNGKVFDPNTAPVRNSQAIELKVPKEIHTLNDAILEAAKTTAKAGKGRRRIVYVISDGKEYGSQAKMKDVIRYLQTNKIAVYGTLVGDSSMPVIGYLDKIHLPLTMRDNALIAYKDATGGNLEAELRQKGIEESFQKIFEEVRTQYTVGYYSHEPFIDGKYRTLELRVMRPNLTVIAKKGYFPTASDSGPENIIQHK
ncbi:MAG: VWA domain-containing protein [Edaphobacter sp.]|uniref:VWA domain-containing protein n=1 Tax=Edaphobacter sp. TaxID=1934404 RepID=UPI002393A41F|nr:VWA domain-containing protein [Edaphobacter sp.]MDE1175949.1 VWA domain-containing protein [Edaphobacter sp.]